MSSVDGSKIASSSGETTMDQKTPDCWKGLVIKKKMFKVKFDCRFMLFLRATVVYGTKNELVELDYSEYELDGFL